MLKTVFFSEKLGKSMMLMLNRMGGVERTQTPKWNVEMLRA
jgi:hypothetical protein